jgi:hypothetical protein
LVQPAETPELDLELPGVCFWSCLMRFTNRRYVDFALDTRSGEMSTF